MWTEYAGALERARQHRDRYEEDSIARAQEADRSGYSNPNMFSNELRTMSNNNRARFAAQANPAWDAYFQLAQEAGGGKGVAFGGGRRGGKVNARAAVSGLQAAADPYAEISTDEMIEAGQASRAQGNQILQRNRQEATKSKAAYQAKYPTDMY